MLNIDEHITVKNSFKGGFILVKSKDEKDSVKKGVKKPTKRKARAKAKPVRKPYKEAKPVDVEYSSVLKDSFGAYATHVVRGRAIPDIRDGLLPVQRRVLYSMYREGFTSKKPFVKSAKPVATTMGNFHPHGDCYLGDTSVRLLSGEVKTMKELYEIGEDQEVLSIDKTGKIVPAIAHSFRIGQHTDKVYHIELLNGFKISVTGNHPFRRLDGTWVKAEDIKPLEILDYANIKTDIKGLYDYVSGYKTNTEYLHQLVFNYFHPKVEGKVIHHINSDKKDNRASNLEHLTRAEHAEHHQDYLKGLEKGRYSMFNPDGKYYEKTKVKNSKLMSFNNKYISIIKANKTITNMKEKGLPLTLESYETYRPETYNLPHIDRMITKGDINSFEQLLELNAHPKGIHSAIKEVKGIVEENSLVEAVTEKHTKTIKQDKQHKLLAKPLIKAIQKLGRVPLVSELTSQEGFFKTEEEMHEAMFNLVPIVKEVTIEDVEQEPMYDFTVDEHENMLISASNDSNLLLSAHNSSLYEALARMSKQWVQGRISVEMDGNNGSPEGDSAAAMRYTESRLAPYAERNLLSSLKLEGIVPMNWNFDDTLKEPEYLPAKVPNLLINGSAGIGVGYASNYPTFNILEVLEGCIELIKNPDLDYDKLFEIIPSVDFPTGGVIAGYREYQEVLSSGGGSIKVRGKYRLIENKDGTTDILFTELPHNMGKKADVIAIIDEAIEKKQLSGVLESLDDSARGDVGLTIRCDENADIQAILAFLFTKTPLMQSVKVNMTVIWKNKPQKIGIKESIKAFNEFRLETYAKGLVIEIANFKAKKHLADGRVLLVDNLEEIIEIIRGSSSKAESKELLISRIGFSDIQADNVLGIQLYRISNVDKEAYVNEVAELTQKIMIYETVLNDENLIKEQVIKGYEQAIKEQLEDDDRILATSKEDSVLFDVVSKRKTQLVAEPENWVFNATSVIPEETVMVGINRHGYIKRSNIRSYTTTQEHDPELIYVGKTSTRKNLIVVTQKGEYMYIPVHRIPETKWGNAGTHINTLDSKLENEELVFAIEYDETNKNQQLLIIKDSGLIKLTPTSEYERTRGFFTLTSGIKMKKDELVVGGFEVIEGERKFLAFEDDKRQSMYFGTEEIAQSGRTTAGSKGININLKQGRTLEFFEMYDKEEDIPFTFEYRERGSKGWTKTKAQLKEDDKKLREMADSKQKANSEVEVIDVPQN